MSNINNLKICFISLGAYPLLSGSEYNHITGPDLYFASLAKEFLNKDFDVSFIAYGINNEKIELEEISGIKIIKIPRSNTSRKYEKLSFIFNVFHSIKKADADIYLNHGLINSPRSIICRILGKKSIYRIGSDALANTNLVKKNIKEFNLSGISLSRIENSLEIKLANCVVAQNMYQKNFLKKNFSKNSILIKNPVTIKKSDTTKKDHINVLWVGSMAEVKQPELFVKLAEKIPEATFQMIGGHANNQNLYEKIMILAERIPNFEFIGFVPFEQIDRYYCEASLLVNTSMFEGFPNAFLQAWVNYSPVVSLNVDPDGVISEKRLGVHSKNFDNMVSDIKLLLNNDRLRYELSQNGRQYVEENHDINLIANDYIDLFQKLTG